MGPFPKGPAYTDLTVLDCRKVDIENHIIDMLYEFSTDSSRDLKF